MHFETIVVGFCGGGEGCTGGPAGSFTTQLIGQLETISTIRVKVAILSLSLLVVNLYETLHHTAP